ncbi:unnamed protein product [Diamesa hyperborea]
MGVFLWLIIGTLTALYFYLSKSLNYLKKMGVVCDEPSLILGNLGGVGQHIHFVKRIHETYEKYKFGHKLCGFYFMRDPRLIIIDLELIKNILIKDFNHFVDRGLYHNEKDDPLSAHLFAIEGDKWRTLRNKLTSTFTSGKMKMMFNTIAAYSNDLVDLIEEIDIKRVCIRYTADVIGSCGFGLECYALKDENSEMLKVADFFNFKAKKDQFVFLFTSSFPNLSKRLGIKLTPDFVSEFFMKVIKDTYEFREQNDIKRNDFMSLLMQIKKYGKLKDEKSESVGTMTFNELAAQAFIFFIAGFETSSTAMNYAFYELAYRQTIQDKLRDEITEVLQRHNNEITYDAIMEMTYLDKVVNETLRKYPVVGVLLRFCSEDYDIPDSKHVIKKGTQVLIPVYGIHTDENIYPNPTQFDPSRFNPEEVAKRHNCAFIPFGDGPRVCIGQRFALLQVKYGLAKVLLEYELTVDAKTISPLQLTKGSITVEAKGGIWLNYKKLHKEL